MGQEHIILLKDLSEFGLMRMNPSCYAESLPFSFSHIEVFNFSFSSGKRQRQIESVLIWKPPMIQVLLFPNQTKNTQKNGKWLPFEPWSSDCPIKVSEEKTV